MSSHNKPSVLIIDDHWTRDRKEIYESVLSESFELFNIENAAQIYYDLERIDVDIYLIDIVLSGWLDPKTNTPLEILAVLKSVNPNKPIVLVSNEYENLLKENKLTPLMNEIIQSDYNVTEFIVWNDFEKAAHESTPMYKPTIVSKLKLQLMRFSKRKNKQYSIPVGIVAALASEIDPFLELFPDGLEEEIYQNYLFSKGTITTIQGKRVEFVAARQSEMGMVDCAYLTSIMATKFNVKHLFMIGVCGGREEVDVAIGDVIIPKESISYQSGKLTPDGLIPDFGYASSNSGLANIVNGTYYQNVLGQIFNSYQEVFFKKNGKYLGDVEKPKVIFDEMACGDYIIDKPNVINQISDATNRRKLCSVEMESYAVLKMPIIFPNIKCTVIKAVMDLTSKKSDKYKNYAAYISGNLLYHILTDEKYKVE